LFQHDLADRLKQDAQNDATHKQRRGGTSRQKVFREILRLQDGLCDKTLLNTAWSTRARPACRGPGSVKKNQTPPPV
jgi:hypothetical protein